MRIVAERQPAIVLGALAGTPRVVRKLRTETVNDPAQIARQPRMTSVNGALQVDLLAQAAGDVLPAQLHRQRAGRRRDRCRRWRTSAR
jgi:hypothetical protein